MRATIRCLALMALLSCGSIAFAAKPVPSGDRISQAADRLDILETSARFDNALDSEDADRFASTFAPDGVLAGFWGESRGTEQIKGAHAYMLSTFARDKRHVVTNHEIRVTGDRATMYCYLTVFDRKTLAVTGTATFTDELVRIDGEWKFARRTLAADPNVDGIIRSLDARK